VTGYGYIRCSSDSQIDGTSLQDQSKKIEAYCNLKGFELVHIYSDAGVSGGIPIAERPEGSKMISTITNGEAIITPKLDRAFRNVVDCMSTIDILDKAGIGLHIIDLGGNAVDAQSPAGRFMISVLASAMEMEKNLIRDRCNAGRKIRQSEGCCVGGLRFGYDLDGKKLVPNQTEQKIIASIRQMKLNKFSLSKIADKLNNRGYKTKQRKPWTFGSVHTILKSNPT